MKIKTPHIKLAFTIVALLASGNLWAGSPPPPPPPPMGIPVDVGAAIILVIGAALAGYTIYKRSHKQHA